jgi:adenylate cyclase class IV
MMKVINVEIKAICRDHERIRQILLKKKANFIGKGPGPAIVYFTKLKRRVI